MQLDYMTIVLVYPQPLCNITILEHLQALQIKRVIEVYDYLTREIF